MSPTPPLSTAVADLDLDKLEELARAAAEPGTGTVVAGRFYRECGPSTALALISLARSAAPAPTADQINWRAKCEVLLDIWDDEKNPPDSRCYIEGAFRDMIDEIRTALAAPASDIAAAPEQQQDHVAPPFAAPASQHGIWLPIESAPRDGSHILIGCAGDNIDTVPKSTLGWWIEAEDDGVDYMGADAGFMDCMCQEFGPGRSFGSESYRHAGTQPTHWMPLPIPPAKEGFTPGYEVCGACGGTGYYSSGLPDECEECKGDGEVQITMREWQ